MAVLYSKTTFDEDDCSKIRDILLSVRYDVPELATEWQATLDVFLNELKNATSITIECDNRNIL